MTGRFPGVLRLLVVLAVVASPFVTHAALTAAGWGMIAYVLVLGQAAFAIWLVWQRVPSPYRQPIVAALCGLALVLCLDHLRSGLVVSSGLPHALANLGLLILFGLSLRPGRTPLITALSHQIHGSLPARIDRYTRRVTQVWCGFFAFELVGSGLLLAFAPLAWWSLFVNVLNAPLVALLLIGEKVTRPLWVTNPPHECFADMVTMGRWISAKLAGAGRGRFSARES